MYDDEPPPAPRPSIPLEVELRPSAATSDGATPLEISLARLVSAAQARGLPVVQTYGEPRLARAWSNERITPHAMPRFRRAGSVERQRSVRDGSAGCGDRRVLEPKRHAGPPTTRWSAFVNCEARPWLAPVVEHLEALGFGLEEDPSSGVLRGRRPEGVTLFHCEPMLLQARTYVSLNERVWTEPRGALALANRLSEGLVVARATLDDGADLAITASHVGEYERHAFQAFMARWLEDLRSMPEHEGDAWAYYREPIAAEPAGAAAPGSDDDDENGGTR